MKNLVGITCSTILLIALVGCTPGGGSGTATGDDLIQASKMERKLPRGMEINFPYHLLSDGRLHDNSSESPRLVRVEYLDVDREEVITTLDRDFRRYDYEPATRQELSDGSVQLRYEHERADLAAIVTVKEGGDLDHAQANGLAVLTFPPKSESDPDDGI